MKNTKKYFTVLSIFSLIRLSPPVIEVNRKFKEKLAIIYILILLMGLMALPMRLDFQSPGRADTESDEPVTFTNVTYEAGFSDVGGNFLAWGDYNDDGYQDLLVNGRRLFENNGPPNWDFTEVTSQVGISGGNFGTWADWNNDGYLDIYTAGSDKLYKNNGPPNWDFSDVTASSGIPQESFSTGIGWGDYDNDGFVDLYKLRGEDYEAGIYYPDRLYHNNGDGTFTDVTEEAGVSEESDPKYGRGAAWADYNDDGWLDVYISNYRQQENYLYENNGDGTFTDVGSEKGVANAPSDPLHNPDPHGRGGHSVGSIWGDYDNDGYLDLWVTNLNHKDSVRTSDDSVLYNSDGPPDYTFTNVRGFTGIPIKPIMDNPLFREDELFVGCAWGDYDNDGDLDLYLPQIYDNSYAYSFLYRNDGDGTFTDMTIETGVRVWDTYAGCWCDYDNDGDLDLITSGRDSGGNGAPHFVHLFRNEGNSNSWLHIDIRGDGESTNRAGIGARVKIMSPNMGAQIREVEGGMGPHGMQNSLILEFGLGSYTGLVDVEVNWTSDLTQIRRGIEVNQSITIEESPPDLKVVNLYLLDYDPIMGETVDVKAVIESVGETQARSAQIKFYLGSPSNDVTIGDPILLEDIFPGDIYLPNCSWETSSYSGSQTIYCTIEDTDPAEDIIYDNIQWEDVYVRTHNEPPDAVLQAEPTEIEKGESIHFDGSSSTDDTSIIEYYFDFGDGSNSGWIQQDSIDHTYEIGGDFTASLIVRDDDGGESENPSEIDIEVRAKPVAVLTANRTSICKGDSIIFNASGSYDEGGSIEGYYFYFGDGYSHGWTTEPTVTHKYDSKGKYNASLVVRDDDDDLNENTAEVIIDVSSKLIAVLTAIPTTIFEGESVTFNASQSFYEEGVIEEYHFDFGDEYSMSWGTQAEISHTYSSHGVYNASLKVKNDLGEISQNEAEVTITVLEGTNEKPTAIIDSIAPNPVAFGTDITFSGYGEDVDGDIVAYKWRSSVDGELSDKASFQTSSLSQDNHTIYFMVRDDFGMWSDEDSRELKITPAIPSLNITTPENNEKVSGKVMIRGTTSHVGGEVIIVEIKIDDGEWTPVTGTGNWQHELDTEDLSEGTHTIHARAFDGAYYSDVESVTIIVERDDGVLDNLTLIIIIAVIVTVLILFVLWIALRKPPKSKPENMPTFITEGEQFTM